MAAFGEVASLAISRCLLLLQGAETASTSLRQSSLRSIPGLMCFLNRIQLHLS